MLTVLGRCLMEGPGDLEQEGEDEVLSKRKSPAKHNRISSSEEEAGCSKDDVATLRSSQRVCRHSNRLEQKKKKVFCRPKRDKMWNAIESKDFRSSQISPLKPRKLKFDLTKITSRYNYDPAETSGEESDNSFIVSDDATDPSSSSESEKKHRPAKRQRVKRMKKRRIREKDSSDSDSDTLNVAEKINALQQVPEPPIQQHEEKQSNEEHPALPKQKTTILLNQCCVQLPDTATKHRLISNSEISRKEDFPDYGSSTDTESDTGMIVPKPTRGKRRIVVSDSEESES